MSTRKVARHNVKGKAQRMWGDLTDDEPDIIEGKREELVGRLQAKYGYTKEKTEEAGPAAREECATSNEVGRKGAASAKKAGTRRAAQAAAGGWSMFRDAIVHEPPAARIEHIRAGAQPGFLVGAAEALGVSREAIFKIAGLSVSTANRKIAKRETLGPLVTERLARLAVIEAEAHDAFGDAEIGRAWLRAEEHRPRRLHAAIDAGHGHRLAGG
ncbi:MAG: CsbD family protein [Gammaproteobacteria bacterium]